VLKVLYMCWGGSELKCVGSSVHVLGRVGTKSVGSTVHVLGRIGTKVCWKYCTCAGEGLN